MSRKERIAMFGGTFNPPHKGHIEAARACVNALALDKLYLVPANIPPHKKMPRNSATPFQRLRMAELAAQDIPNCEVWDSEMRRQGKSYTCDTVAELAKAHPEADLWLIMGTDMLETFDRWYKPKEIASHCRLAVVARFDERVTLQLHAKRLEMELGADIDIVENPVLPLSSTDFRTLHRADMLTSNIWKYICENEIYGELYDFDALRDYAKSHMSEARYIHTVGCEKTAVQLAKRWDTSVDDSRAAAILHDITKDVNFEQQLKLCEKYDIMVNYDTNNEKQLFHADTAAAVAEHELNMPPQVVSAIKNHTLGAIYMSDLDKVIFMADMIEPSRDFEGLHELRVLAMNNLDSAVAAAMAQTIEYVKSRGKAPNSRTEAVLFSLNNALMKG